MKNKNSQKSTYTFVGIAILAILTLLSGWLYLSSQTTKVVLITDKTNYFPSDQIELTVSLENYKNADTASIVVNYPDESKVLDTKTEKGITTRSLKNSIVFEANKSFFDTKQSKLGIITFDPGKLGELNFSVNKDLTTLSSDNTDIDIKEINDLSVSVGIASDDITEPKESKKSAVDF